MRYVSTRGNTPPTSATEALLHGLAPDGGLFFPERIPALDPATPAPKTTATFRESSLPKIAATMMRPYFEGIGSIDEIAASALSFEIPLVEVRPGWHVLELFHGPTLAFKDVGARVFARLLGAIGLGAEPLTILVATSGDTGGAVANAFHGVPGTRVVVMYPEGKVSPLQERQFTTLGGNVTAVAVRGAFDDCQRLAKAAFADRSLRERVRLTSANSISLGRLIPQTIYYAWAWSRLPAGGPAPVVCVPSGNFGNLAAGLIARRMGVPIARFVAATNANDVVPEYLRTGDFRPRPSVSTISNAMDVGDPSNLERIEHLYERDLQAIRRDVLASAHDDAATRDCIRRVDRELGYLLDPHTAVGWLALEELGETDAPRVLVSTAHPAKFREEVEPVIGRVLDIPEELAVGLTRESHAVRIAPREEELRAVLDEPLRS
ncbi:MAG: threonine synthase [bacterium]